MVSAKRTKASSSSSSSSCHQNSSSPDMIASNDDILTLILQCLPPKSLLKFKSVSKHWLSLIADPTFRPKHNPTTISGLFVRRRPGRRSDPRYDFINLSPHPASRAPFRSLTFIDDPYGIKILQSCNGLLLCSSVRDDRSEALYYIYNPTTKHYTVLPRLRPGPRSSSSTLRGNSTLGVCLAFDPSKSPRYKLICIRYEYEYHYQVEIYSSKIGTWSPSGAPFPARRSVRFRNGVFWNGAIHWIDDRGGHSLYFHVEEEKIRRMPMPSIDKDVRPHRHFGESGDHLHLVQVYDLECGVYEMKRDHSAWFVKYKVDLNPVAAAFPDMVRRWGYGYLYVTTVSYYVFSILAVVHEETDEGPFMMLHLPNKIIRYNFMDNSFRKTHDSAILEDDGLKFKCFGAYQFIESFACV